MFDDQPHFRIDRNGIQMDNPVILITFGITVGIFSGLMGLGGGAIMIPVMILLLGVAQSKAHGLSLLIMIPPVTLPAVIKYFQAGALTSADFKVAALVALGVLLGSYLGASVADWIVKTGGQTTLKMIFGAVLVYGAGYTTFSTLGKEHLLRSVVLAGVLLVVATAFLFTCKWIDARSANSEAPSVQTPAPTDSRA